MSSTIRPRGGTAAQWVAANPVLAVRELGIETDTRKVKIGDGSTGWIALPYVAVDAAAINGLDTAIGDALETAVVAGNNITVDYDPTTRKLTISAAEAGLTAVGLAELPAGVVVQQPINANGTYTRPTTRTDLVIQFIAGPNDAPPASVTPPALNGAYNSTNSTRGGDLFARRGA